MRAGDSARSGNASQVLSRAFIVWQGSIIEAVGTCLTGKNLPAEFVRLAQTRPAFPVFAREHVAASGVLRRKSAITPRFSLRVTVQVA